MAKESSQTLKSRLLASESRLRSIFLAAPVGIGVVVDRIIKDANNRLCDMTGYSNQELVGQNARILYLTDTDYESVGSEKYRQIAEKGTGSVETRWRKKDGTVIDVLLSSTPFNPFDLAAGVTFTALDITGQKRTEKELRLNESRLASLLKLSQMSVESERMLTDFALEKAIDLTESTIGYLAFMNEEESILTMYSWSKTAIRECAIEDKPIEYPVEKTGLWGEAVRQRRPVITNNYQAENLLKKGYPKGHVSVLRHMNIPVLDREKIVLVAGVGNKKEPYENDDVEQLTLLMDGMWKIIKAKRIEKELDDSKGRYRLIAEKMNDIIWTTDLSLRTTYVSPSVEKVLGFTPEERMFRNPEELMTPESFTRATENLANEFQRDSGPGIDPDRTIKMDVEYYHKDGSIIWCENIVGALRDEKGAVTGIHGVSRDITERKRAEEELRHEKQRFHDLIHNAPFGMLMIDKCGRFNYANPKFTEIFGYNLSDVPDGKRWFELAYPDPEYRKQVISAWIEDSEAYGPGEKRPRIFEVTCKDDSRKIIHFIPVRLETGENLAVCEDITERTTLEDQFRHAQKMESVGRLAGGVAHDFNNMLQAIMGYAELALLKAGTGSSADSSLIQIKQAAQRSADLVRQLLAFARKQTVSPRVLDLNSTVADMIKILQRLIGEEIDLVWKPGTDTWAVKMDPAQIDQILANLLVNARDSISGAGTVSIKTENAVIDEFYCRARPGFIPGEYAVLAVGDTGSGMDKETLSHIFEPFFTTKEMGSGTGLGLSTVYGIVKQNCGFIDVYSEESRGTTFKIYLPSCHDQAEVELHAQEKITSGGAETVLVVEDEQMLLEFVCSILEEHGYKVLSALTPADALSLIGEYSSPVHLLITDVVMPGMNGLELKSAVLKMHPETRTLFISGHPADVIARQGVLEKSTMFLQKPFLVAALTEKVRQVLEG